MVSCWQITYRKYETRREVGILPNEAKILDYMFTINFKELTISLLVIAVFGVALYALGRKIQEILGIETKTMLNRRLINGTIENLS